MSTIRLLTIGNSFANNALTYLDALAESAGGVRFVTTRANLGGCSLEKHWNLAMYSARQPEFKTYALRISGADGPEQGSLQDVLELQPWDVITLQQVSFKSWQPSTFQPWLSRIHDLVKERAPTAQILLHQTWACRSDAPFLPQHGLTQDLMHQRIVASYEEMAHVLGCGIIPSGAAIHRARKTPGRTFRWPDPDYDYARGQAPALPRQDHSLAVGWNWAIQNTANGIPELRLDDRHLNPLGCYLVGCVWLETLAGVDCRTIAFRPDGIDEDTGAFLRETAHAAIAGVLAGHAVDAIRNARAQRVNNQE